MGAKRRKNDSDCAEEITSTGMHKEEEKQKMSGGQQQQQLLPSTIKNKEKRSAVHAKLKQQKKLDKRKKAKAREALEKRALELGEEGCSFHQRRSLAQLKILGNLMRQFVCWMMKSCLLGMTLMSLVQC